MNLHQCMIMRIAGFLLVLIAKNNVEDKMAFNSRLYMCDYTYNHTHRYIYIYLSLTDYRWNAIVRSRASCPRAAQQLYNYRSVQVAMVVGKKTNLRRATVYPMTVKRAVLSTSRMSRAYHLPRHRNRSSATIMEWTVLKEDQEDALSSDLFDASLRNKVRVFRIFVVDPESPTITFNFFFTNMLLSLNFVFDPTGTVLPF